MIRDGRWHLVLTAHGRVRPTLTHLVLLAALMVAGCVGPDVAVYERPDGTIIVESIEAKATVEAVDARERTITLKRKFHKAKTFKVDENLANFNQIQAGDEVHVELIEEFAVALVPGGAPAIVEAAVAVAVAPDGSKPALVTASTIGITAEIIAIDSHGHHVTLEMPDGKVESVRVAKHIDLEKLSLGDSVFIQVTEAVAIGVVKP